MFICIFFFFFFFFARLKSPCAYINDLSLLVFVGVYVIRILRITECVCGVRERDRERERERETDGRTDRETDR